MKRNTSGLGAAVFCTCATAGLLIFGSRFSNGVADGLTLAAGIFIPAMLPYYFIVALVNSSLASMRLSQITAPLCRKWGYEPAAGSVILMGLLGGYPAGAIAVGDACRNGTLDASQARRLMMFCTNAGPGFIIGAVGKTMLGSTKAGILLYCAHLLSTITVAIATNCKAKKLSRAKKAVCNPLPFPIALTESVVKACHSSLYAAGFIALSCGVISVTSEWAERWAKWLPSLLCALTEVTKGCLELTHQTYWSASTTVLCISAAIGFGGISVLLQLFSFCGRWVSIKSLLKARAINALLNAGYCLLLCLCFGTPEITLKAAQTSAMVSSQQNAAAYLLIVIGLALTLAQQTQKLLGVPFQKKM